MSQLNWVVPIPYKPTPQEGVAQRRSLFNERAVERKSRAKPKFRTLLKPFTSNGGCSGGAIGYRVLVSHSDGSSRIILKRMCLVAVGVTRKRILSAPLELALIIGLNLLPFICNDDFSL